MIGRARRLPASSAGAGAWRALLVGLLVIAAVTTLLAALGDRAHAQGVTGYQEITGATVTVTGFQTLSGSASCPTGDVVVSGGYTVSGGNMRIIGSAPVDANASVSKSMWTVTGFDNGDGQGSFTPYAICVSSGVAGYAEPNGANTVGAGSAASVTQQCGSGTVIVGGGFSSANTALIVTESDPTSSSNVSSTTWTAFVNNSADNSSVNLTVYAVCVAASLSGYSEQLQESSTAGTVSAQCPSGSLVIGGGGSAPAPSVDGPLVQDPTTGTFVLSSTNWSLDAASTGGGVISSIAICAAPAPVVVAVKPASGPAAGGTSVTISGSAFTGATAVNFGSTAATSFTVNSATSDHRHLSRGLRCRRCHRHHARRDEHDAAPMTFTYTSVPSVTGRQPDLRPPAGGTSVTITGTGFTGATAVKFGSTAASSFTVNSATQITATSPAGTAGAVDITVTTPGGTSADRAPPTSTPTWRRRPSPAVSPTAGPPSGGTSVTITGHGFHRRDRGQVRIDRRDLLHGQQRDPDHRHRPRRGRRDQSTSPSRPRAAPARPAAPTSSPTRPRRPSPPVSPTAGPLGGGTASTITGTDFTGATRGEVRIDRGVVVHGQQRDSDHRHRSGGCAGTVDITVTTAGRDQPDRLRRQVHLHRRADRHPGQPDRRARSAAGTASRSPGPNSPARPRSKFGSTAATSFTVNSATQITATSPAGAAGTVDVTVTTAGGTSPTGAGGQVHLHRRADRHRRQPDRRTARRRRPASRSPGTSLTGATAVKFGSTAAPAFTVNSAT